MSGAPAANTVPQIATATPARWRSGRKWRRKLERPPSPRSSRSTKAKVGKFTIDVAKGADGVDVKVTGMSAHGSRPEEGVNPLPRLALFLQESGVALGGQPLHQGREVPERPVWHGLSGRENWRGLQDDFMGPLTISPNLIREARRQAGSDGQCADAARQHARKAHPGDKGQGQCLGRRKSEHRSKIDYAAGRLDGTRSEGRLVIDPAQHLRRHHRPRSQTGTHRRQHDRQSCCPTPSTSALPCPARSTPRTTRRSTRKSSDLDADMQMFTEMLVRIGNLKQMQ